MLLGWTRFHDLPFLGEEAFFTCRGRMLHIRTETFLGNRGRSKDRHGCGRTFVNQMTLLHQLAVEQNKAILLSEYVCARP